MRAFAASLAIVSLGCADSADRTSAARMASSDVVSADTVPIRILPELPGALGGRRSVSAIMPSDSAPPCAGVAPAPDAWPVSRAATPSRDLAAVELRLPGRFVLRQSNDTPPDSGQHGSFLVGTWHDTTSGGGSDFPAQASVAIWVDAHGGYPTMVADTASRQLSVEECIAAAPAAGTRVVMFDVDTPEGRQSVLGAVWQIAPGRYLRLLGASPAAAGQDTLLRALGSIRVERR